MLVVKAKIREHLPDGIRNVSEKFPEALEQKVVELIKEAARRASDNGRRTLMTKDL